MAITLIVQTDEGTDGANVYDSLASYVTFLTDEGYTDFVGLSVEIQTRLAVQATRQVERELARRFSDSCKLEHDQRLLFPRDGAFDREGFFIEGLPPVEYRNGIMVFADELARAPNHRLVIGGHPRGHYKSESVNGWSATYRNDQQTFEDQFPAVWDLAASAFQAGLRQVRA